MFPKRQKIQSYRNSKDHYMLVYGLARYADADGREYQTSFCFGPCRPVPEKPNASFQIPPRRFSSDNFWRLRCWESLKGSPDNIFCPFAMNSQVSEFAKVRFTSFNFRYSDPPRFATPSL
jgi:hypothetical protein